MTAMAMRLRLRRLCCALLLAAGVLVFTLVLGFDGPSAQAAGDSSPPISNAPALLPTPTCPTPPSSEAAPWADPQFGADCQAQFVIDDLENPASSLYQHAGDGTPTQTTLERLEAALASGRGGNIIAASGAKSTLLALYGLTATGGSDDGATGERSSGLAFPSALALGASWNTALASAYGTMFGQEFHRTGESGTLAPVIDIDRTWRTGRENENFGEDPFLTGSMAAPEIRAIQGQGVMTTVKHCCAYTQEQGRAGQALSLTSAPIPNTGDNELVSERALEEIYGPAWQAAVAPDQGNAMSVMCGYAILNGATPPPYTGADSCGNKFLLNDLIKGQYGFQGDFTPDAVTAKRDADVLNFENGGDGGDVSLTLAALQAIVGNGSGDGQINSDGTQNIITQARLVDEVRRLVLQSTKNERFLHPPTNTGIDAGVASDEATSAEVEEQGAVLLKNQSNALPLSRHSGSIAVIGTQAGPNSNAAVGPISTEQPQADNDGSPFVDPTNTFTDTTTGQTFGYSSALSGILAAAGSHQTVTYSPGSVGLVEQPALASNGNTSGADSVVTPDRSQAGFLATYFGGDDPTDQSDPVLGTQVVPSVHYDSTGGATGPTSIPAVPGGSPAVAIPTQFQDNNWSVSYQGTFTPPTTGDYNFSVGESGTVKLYVDGKLVEQRLRDDFGYIDHVTVPLRAGRPTSIVVDYSPMAAAASNASGSTFANFGTFLGDEVHLGVALPPTTGETLIKQASENQGPGATKAEYPGITDLTTGASDDYNQIEQENYDEGIDVGYRYYEVQHQTPLFPFGYGLSYSSFQQRIVGTRVHRDGAVVVSVADTSRGPATGADVIEGYVQDPSSTGEPPEQLRAFSKVTFAPGNTAKVKLTFRPSSFAYWDSGPASGTTPRTTSPSSPGVDNSTQPGGQWTIAAGQYTISVGSSSTQFDDSTRIHLTGNAPAGQLTGLFGWSLP
jgi:beta-glucosidase